MDHRQGQQPPGPRGIFGVERHHLQGSRPEIWAKKKRRSHSEARMLAILNQKTAVSGKPACVSRRQPAFITFSPKQPTLRG
jgi:hypothetical protein